MISSLDLFTAYLSFLLSREVLPDPVRQKLCHEHGCQSKKKKPLEALDTTRLKLGLKRNLVERSQIILMSADGVTNAEQGRFLNVDRQRPRRWRLRWAAAEERLATAEAEGVSDRELVNLVARVLSDRERPGGPPGRD